MDISLEKIEKFLASEDAAERRQAVILAVKGNATSLTAKITQIAGSDPDQQLRALARKALERLRVPSMAADTDKYADVHFEQLLQSEDPYARFAGLKKALTQNNEVARLCINAALEKESVPQLKASMIMAVGRFKLPDDVQTLSEYINDADSRVRANTVEALANIGGEQANRYIIAMMGDDDNRVKANVVKALKGLGGPNLLVLLRKMAEDERVWMRASAVYAFGKIKSPQSLVALAQIAAGDSQLEIREKALAVIKKEHKAGNPAAAVILAKLSSTVAEENHLAHEEITQELKVEGDLQGLLNHEDPCKRYLGLSQLGNNFEAHKQEFLKAFQKEADAFLLSMMLTGVKEQKLAGAVNRCIQLLKHDDDRVRANAIEAAAAVEVASSAEFIIPLLKDKNSRVAANAVMALGSIGRIDIFDEVQKLLGRGREAFRQSALYVIAQQRESRYVPILEKLLQDPSPKVRDRAYDVLREFSNEQVSGSIKVLQKIDKRISLEKSRDNFFENSLDKMFGSLVEMIKSEDREDKEAFVFVRTPEAEQQALIALAQKSLENDLGDLKTIQMLQQIDEELQNIEKLTEEVAGSQSQDESVKDAADKMSEIELLKIEEKSLNARRNALLAGFAMDIYGNRRQLDLHSQAALRVEIARVEGSLCAHVPKGEFSMLPDNDAPISEIFDVAMRLYQKHVWTFSLKTCLKFLLWLVYAGIFGFVMFLMMFIHPLAAGLFALVIGPALAYKSLGLFIEWKALITCMVDDLIHGRSSTGAEWKTRVNAVYSHVFSAALRKYFFLLAYFIIASIISGVIFGGTNTFLKATYLATFGKLLGFLMFLLIMAPPYFKYMLIEPVSVFVADKDAFVFADGIFKSNKIKLGTLIVFSTFIMTLITGYSTQAISFLTPVLPAVVRTVFVVLVAMLSEICLFPIAYACIVIYTLMFIKNKDKQKKLKAAR
jgi:HEAT repeat protein